MSIVKRKFINLKMGEGHELLVAGYLITHNS